MTRKVSALVGYKQNTTRAEYEVPDNEPGVWGIDRNFSVAGTKNVPRLDAVEKATGKAKYTYDIKRPRMLHAALVTCPYSRALVKNVDISEAKQAPGVQLIELFENVVGQEAKCAGWKIAVVVAETLQQARDAAKKVKVEYEERPFVHDLETAMDNDAPEIHSGGNVSKANIRENGDVEKGFQEADVIHEGTYSTQVQTHSCLETHGCIAEWNGDELTVWFSTQAIWIVARGLADAFRKEGLTVNKTRCITQHMGGGFGSKFGAEDFGILCARMAKKLGRPVKLMMDRTVEALMMGNKPSAKMTIKLGAKRDGTLTALYVKTYNVPGYTGSDSVSSPFFNHYDCPNIKCEERNVFINAGASRAFRAPGCPQGSFGLEMAMDELAQKLNLHPFDLRVKNISGNPLKALPYEFKLGADRFQYKEKYNNNASQKGRFRRGVGCGITHWSNAGWPGGAIVRCNIFPDGSVEFANSCQDIGTGTRAALAITGAEELGIDVGFVDVSLGDTNLGLPGPYSGGSSVTPCVTPALRSAAYKAKQRLFKQVAAKWNVSAEDLDCKNSVVFCKSDADKKVNWAEACAMLSGDGVVTLGEYVESPKFPGSGGSVFGAQFAEVEVDTETGKVKVLKVTAVQDCGKTIAKNQAETQIIGAVTQGVTSAILETRVIDNVTGRPLNPNMESYKILCGKQSPEIEPILLDVIDPVNVTGAKGLGEPPYIPTAGAIACAVSNALGVPIREIPITPDKVLTALQEKEG